MENKSLEALENILLQTGDNGYDFADRLVIEKDLDDFKWLKSKLNITFLNSLPDVEDKIRVLDIMGITYEELEK